MKILLTILFFIQLLCNTAFGQITGGSISDQWKTAYSNQWITSSRLNNAILNGYFTQVRPFNTSGQWITKDSIPNWVAIVQTNSYYLPKTYNQIIAKRDLTPMTVPVCGNIINFPQLDNSGSSIYIHAGTNSGKLSMVFDTVQTSYGNNASMAVMYGSDTLNKWTPFNYIDTTITVNYSYDQTLGDVLQVIYLTGGFHFDANYNVSLTCSGSITNTIYYSGFTSNPGTNFDALSLPYSVSADPSQTTYTLPTTNFSGLYYFVVREPMSLKQRQRWNNGNINSGVIPDQVWQTSYVTQNYRYYVTNGQQSFNGSYGITLSDTGNNYVGEMYYWITYNSSVKEFQVSLLNGSMGTGSAINAPSNNVIYINYNYNGNNYQTQINTVYNGGSVFYSSPVSGFNIYNLISSKNVFDGIYFVTIQHP